MIGILILAIVILIIYLFKRKPKDILLSKENVENISGDTGLAERIKQRDKLPYEGWREEMIKDHPEAFAG